MSDRSSDNTSNESVRNDVDSMYSMYVELLSQWLERKAQTDYVDARETVHDFLTTKLCPEAELRAFVAKYRAKKFERPSLRFRGYLRASVFNSHIDKLRKRERERGHLERLMSTVNQGEAIICETQEEGDEFDRSSALNIFNKAINDARDYCLQQGRKDDLWYIIEKKFFEPLRDGCPAPGVGELAAGLPGKNPATISNLVVTAQRCLYRAIAESIMLWEGLDTIDSDEERKEAFREAMMRLRQRLLERNSGETSPRRDMGHSLAFAGSETSVADISGVAASETQMSDSTASLWDLLLQSSLNDVVAIWRDWARKAPEPVWGPLKAVKHQRLKEILYPPLSAAAVSLPVLKALRDAAKNFGWDLHRQVEAARRKADSGLEQELKLRRKVLEAMYLVPIAMARVRYDEKLSTDGDERFAIRFGKLRRAGWIDASSEALIKEWMLRFGPESPAAL